MAKSTSPGLTDTIFLCTLRRTMKKFQGYSHTIKTVACLTAHYSCSYRTAPIILTSKINCVILTLSAAFLNQLNAVLLSCLTAVLPSEYICQQKQVPAINPVTLNMDTIQKLRKHISSSKTRDLTKLLKE